ncbi:MAG: chromosome segregation protein SMC, partial [Methanomassiliicoccaceae archaeon]|nr:chromosome segregation protein SMC [Methanomassiliicoccaceae archaeon]
DVRAEIRAHDDDLHSVSKESAGVAGKIAGYEAQLTILREKRKKAAEDLAAEKGKLTEAQKELDAASRELKKVTDELESLRAQRSELREKMVQIAPADLQEMIQRTQDNVLDLQTELNALSAEYAALEAEKDGIENRKKSILKDIKNAEEKIEAKLAEKGAAEVTIERLTVELEGHKKIEADFESKLSDLRDARDNVMKGKITAESERDNITEKITLKEGILAGFDAKIQIIDETVRQLKEEVSQLTTEVILPVPSEEELNRTIRSCETVMAKIGNVNLRAIDDYDQKKERHTLLSEDVGKMNSRIKELTDLMASINKEKKGLFMGVYEGVNANFKEVYAELSGGGEAFMSLENEDDPFDGGLMINAKPKNGKLLRLDALSGGEKSLTAMAFIFAIQELQPAPLYALDEVDQNLDSVNSEMVAQRIKKGSAKAQFIQVSLRRVALAVADHLIGVTRLPSGKSKIIIQPDLAEVSKYENEAEDKRKAFEAEEERNRNEEKAEN